MRSLTYWLRWPLEIAELGGGACCLLHKLPDSSKLSSMVGKSRVNRRQFLCLLLLAGLSMLVLYSTTTGSSLGPSSQYKDICYVTVPSEEGCRELCHLDLMCFHSFYYPSLKSSNCFTELFFNSSESGCRPYNRTDMIYQSKDSNTVKSFQEKHTIDTPVCHKPNYHPFDRSLTHTVTRENINKDFTCSLRGMAHRFQITDDDQIKLVDSTSSGEKCQFRYVLRTDNYTESDEDLEYSDWLDLEATPTPLTDEFVTVICTKNGHETYRYYSSYVPAVLAKKRSELALKRTVDAHSKSGSRFGDKMSVLMFGIDSTSLSQSYRQLPRTMGYLSQNMHGHTFKGYNRVQDNTFMNVYALLTGKPVVEDVGISMYRFFDDDPLMFKWFRQDQFVTAYYEDYKLGSTFNWLKRGFHYKPTDHYFRPFSVAVEKDDPHAWSSDFCYMDKGTHIWLGDWTRSFAKQYAKLKSPYFLWSYTTLLAHEEGNLMGKGDAYYYELFQEMHKSGSLNNTVLVFFSDHGYRYGGLRATKIGQNEENHPMMTWVFPEWFEQKYKSQMDTFKLNVENRLTTPFDVHRTVLEFANGAVDSATREGMSNFGSSLFEPISERRTCEQAGIPDHFCGCREPTEYPLTDILSVKAAQAVVDRLNKINEVAKGKCLIYKVDKVIQSYRQNRHDLTDGNIVEMSVTVRVMPSDAQFSATVHVYLDDSLPPAVKGISRVSLYGSSADCVDDFRLRRYCTCKPEFL